jgi:transcriptional regulator with XRE-family HTH domain
MKRFSEKLKEARRARGMTQAEFGELLGVTPRMIIEYEKGSRRPHRRKVQEFADILEVPVEYLLEDRFDDVLSVFRADAPADDAPADDERRASAAPQPQSDIEAQARREIEFLRERSAALFAGGALPQDAKDAFFQSLYEAYLKCREQAAENGVDVDKFGY